jgi:hypothetical protein
MKTLVITTIVSIIFFIAGFYISKRITEEPIEHIIKVPVNEFGRNVSYYAPVEYHLYMHNWVLNEYLKFNDSLFNKGLNEGFYLDISINKKGSNALIKKEGNYYECIVYGQERKEYSFNDFYLMTPDTIYRLTLTPLKFQFDTIRPIK